MAWLRSNIVGLLGVLLIIGSPLVTLYVKAEVNSEAIVQLKKTVEINGVALGNQTSALNSYAMRTAHLEGQVERFAKSNERLVIALDKLDVIYNSLRVSNAIQDERLKQLTERVVQK